MDRIGTFEFVAPLWRHPGDDGWHFVSVPPETSDDLTDLSQGIRRGFGSVRVSVTVGATTWRTSVFPDRRSGTYLLPMKRSVRDAERLRGYGAPMERPRHLNRRVVLKRRPEGLLIDADVELITTPLPSCPLYTFPSPPDPLATRLPVSA